MMGHPMRSALRVLTVLAGLAVASLATPARTEEGCTLAPFRDRISATLKTMEIVRADDAVAGGWFDAGQPS